MIDLSPEIVAILMLGGILLGVALGYPFGIVIGALALIFGIAKYGDLAGELIYARMWVLLLNYTILALPLFVFMGTMLEHSGIAERMYDSLYLFLGGLRGGLAVSTVIIGTIVAACVGIIGASVTMLSVVALPAMINRGYSRSLASGCVCAGGTLGILIPPSVMLVVYGPMAQISVGKLFFGAFIPGFTLSGLYMAYILFHSYIKPEIAPPVPPEQRKVPLAKKWAKLLVSMLPPGILIMSVLGVIFFGIAAPTEAASIGAFVATLLAIAYRKFSWRVLRSVSIQTFKVSGFMLIIASLAYAFVGVFLGSGGGKVVANVILSTPGGQWGIFAVIMLMIFVLGFLIDWIGIVFIMVPIITPIAEQVGFDPIWFALMVCINLQMSFLTPPMAPAIFYLRGSADPSLGVKTIDIIRGVIPYVILILCGMILFVVFPQIILWLPNQMIR
jgi:tripartite ATP-independent transporter DctM subunit